MPIFSTLILHISNIIVIILHVRNILEDNFKKLTNYIKYLDKFPYAIVTKVHSVIQINIRSVLMRLPSVGINKIRCMETVDCMTPILLVRSEQ